MARHETQLISRETIAHETMAFYIKKPPSFSFKAGQYIDIEIPNPSHTDKKGAIRPYSIASSPHEKDLMIATRITDSAFKQHIISAPPGAPLTIEGPMGSVTLHSDDSRPAIFLAGGIGITHTRSIVTDATHRALAHRLYIVHSNRTPQDAPFLDHFHKLKTLNQNVFFIPTMSGLDEHAAIQSGWSGARGRVDFTLISRIPEDLGNAVFYVVGPPLFVKAMVTMLNANGILEENIRTEEFSGY